jgi:hypothetical protein
MTKTILCCFFERIHANISTRAASAVCTVNLAPQITVKNNEFNKQNNNNNNFSPVASMTYSPSLSPLLFILTSPKKKIREAAFSNTN